MKPARWVCCSALAAALWLAPVAGAAASPVYEPIHAALLVNAGSVPPPNDAPWREVLLPDASHDGKAQVVWLRIPFDRPPDSESWAVYWPYLYGGGQFWLNGTPLAAVAQSDSENHVRWQRPHLFPLSDARLRSGSNLLHVRIVAADPPNGLLVARPAIGPQSALLAQHDRRLLWVRTMPQASVVVCLLVAALVAFIWWRRRSEVLYGLFALALALWGLRTLTFVVESLPTAEWTAWRTLYHAATGGYIVVMALFAMRYAGVHRPSLERALFGYWLVGPLARLLPNTQAEMLVGRLWIAGMIPVGISVVVFIGIAWWRDRRAGSAALLAAVAFAVTAGVHDYLVAWRVPLVDAVLPGWAGHRILLMHHGAIVLLIVMGFLLTMRFVRTLFEVEELNQTLEKRVAAREAELAANYQRLAALERERATAEERERIMRDLHDGLGSQLFTSLSRVEREALSNGQVAQVLRDCIADMRLAIEALAPEDQDFRAAIGNFLFRWESALRQAGVQPTWDIDVPDVSLPVAPHAALQCLRVLQEALTNVLKHARATRVRVALRQVDGSLMLRVEDDGQGFTEATGNGRGLANMRGRARRLGASFHIASAPGGTCVTLALPMP
jgi:signal transduction histidine kinase